MRRENMCIFCKIIAGEIPAKIVYEDDNFIVIPDIQPEAPVHFLLIPKQHIDNIMSITPELSAAIFGKMGELAQKFDIAKNGFRLVINTGKDGGQTVEHLHVHILAGRELTWPAG